MLRTIGRILWVAIVLVDIILFLIVYGYIHKWDQKFIKEVPPHRIGERVND